MNDLLQIASVISPQIASAMKDMPQGTHAILVYHNQEMKREVLFSHLSLGIGTSGLVYVGSQETPMQIRSGLEKFGIGVKRLEAEGSLSVKNYDEVYIVDGKVDSARIMSSFAALSWGYARRGKDGIRASAEMSCFFKPNLGHELVKYENLLNTTLSFPAKGLCGYDLIEMGNSGNLGLLWPIIRAHSLVIMTGPNGSFALHPDEVSQEDIARTLAPN